MIELIIDVNKWMPMNRELLLRWQREQQIDD